MAEETAAAPSLTSGTTPPVNNNGGNNGAGEWIQKSFSQEFLNQTQAYDKFKVFKSPDDLGRSYIELQTKMSSTGRLPKEDSPKEDWDNYYKTWGRPDKAEDYKLPEELKTAAGDPAFLGSVTAMAHSLGLNNRQVEQMVKWGVEQNTAIYQQQQQAQQQTQQQLKTEWGYAYESNLDLAKRTLGTLTTGKDDSFIQYLDRKGLSSDPEFIKFFHKLGVGMGEDVVLKPGQTSPEEVTSAQDKINVIRGDKNHPYNNESHPSHKKAIQDMQALYAVVNGA